MMLLSLQTLSNIMQIVTGIAACSIAFIVYRHGKKKDKEELTERSWSAQQQLNLATINDDDIQVAYDVIVSGNTENVDDRILKKATFLTFILLNRIQLIWNGHKAGIFSKAELLKETIPTISLIVRNTDILNYCLTRGYDDEFSQFVKSQIPAANLRAEKIESIDKFLVDTRKKTKKSDLPSSITPIMRSGDG